MTFYCLHIACFLRIVYKKCLTEYKIYIQHCLVFMFNLEKYVAENSQWITENDVNDAIGEKALLN